MVQGWRPAPLPLVPGSRPRPGSGFLGHQHPNPRQPPGPSQDSAPPVHGQSQALSGHCLAQATARGAGSLPSGCTPHGPSHTQRVHACPGSWASPELQPGPGQERHPLLWPSLSGPPLGLTRSRPRARVSGQARHSGIGTRHAGTLPRLAPEAPTPVARAWLRQVLSAPRVDRCGGARVQASLRTTRASVTQWHFTCLKGTCGSCVWWHRAVPSL